MDHDFGTILTTAINPRDDNSSQDEAVEQDKDKINGHNVVSSSSDNRKTISVVIDEDEYDTDLSTSFTSIKSPTEHDFYGCFTPYSDHNYIFGSLRPKSYNSNFPTIEGLNIDSIDDNSSTFLPKTQTFRQLTKRYAPYAYDEEDGNAFYTGTSGFYRNQIKGNAEGRLTQQKLQYDLHNSPGRQQTSGSERLPLTLRPSGRSRVVSTTESQSSAINHGVSLPLQRSYESMRFDSPYMLDGSPAPIVTATRGRPPSGRNKSARIAQEEQLYNQNVILAKDPGAQTGYILPIQTGYSSEQQRKLPEQRQQQRFRQLQKRNISSYAGIHSDKRQPHFNEQQTEEQQRHDIYLEEEEMLNEDFFAQQHQKYSQQQQSSDLERNNLRRIRKDTITPSDPVHPFNASSNLLDTKPPDDPYLPPQQVSQYSGVELQNQQFHHQQRFNYPPGFDTSSIDGTINSVVRGEASVMQQHFGPPISSISEDTTSTSAFQQQNFEPQQQSLNHEQRPSLQIPESIDMVYSQGLPAKQQNSSHFSSDSTMIFQQHPSSSHSTFSHGLDELAQASSNLLDQPITTSSGRIDNLYQQVPSLVSHTKDQKRSQFHQAPSQQSQTLHFKVVQTNHHDEPSSFPQHQNYMQQVFTVQQQRKRPGACSHHDISQPDQIENFSSQVALPQSRQSVSSGRRQRLSSEFSPISIAPNGGIEAEEPELQQIGDFTKPMKWQRSFRKQLSNEVEARKTSTVPARASNANESLLVVKEAKKRGRVSKRNIIETEQQEGLDYITRCICGMKHNDPFMIQCDRCDVWQHGICMNVSEDSVPDAYLCEQCQPRSLEMTPKQAKSIQVRTLIAAKAPRLRKLNKTRSFSSIKYRSKTPALSAALKITSKIRGTKMSSVSTVKKRNVQKVKDRMRPFKSFVNVNSKREKYSPTKLHKQQKQSSTQNQYSRGIRSLMSNMQPYVLGELGLLRRLDYTPLARPMLVAPNIEGLVATPGKNSNIPMGMPIVEYTGAISLLSEVKNRTMNKEHGNKFTLIYSGLGDNDKVFIDATKMGSIARSVRRSCRSNATLQHAIVDGQLRIYLYAAMNIDRSSEVTIPFDYDYRESGELVECACNTLLGMSSMNHCPVYAYNKSLQCTSNNKVLRDKSTGAATLPSKVSVSFPRHHVVSPRQTRNSMASPIPVKFEKETATKFDKQKSDEHKNRASIDLLQTPSPTTVISQRRSPRTCSSIEAKMPKLELAKSPTPNDQNVASLEEENILTRKVLSSSSPISSTKSFSQASQTRTLRSNTSSFMGKIKWGEKPPPNKHHESINVSSSRSPSKKISARLSDTPTSPRLAALLKKPKVEIISKEDENFTREERKLQATIASVERAEHLSLEKKRKLYEKIHPPSEPPIETKLKRKSFNAKTSIKSVQDDPKDICSKKLFEELTKILQMKFKNWQEFKLPSEYDDLRTEVMLNSQGTDKSDGIKLNRKETDRKTEDNSMKTLELKGCLTPQSICESLGHATTSKALITDEEEAIFNQKMISPSSDGCVWKKGQLNECSRYLSLTIPEMDKSSKTSSAPPTTINSPPDTSDVEKPDRECVTDLYTETPIRPPNTKAHKKLTLEEYKRKKKAEMEAKQQQISEDNSASKKTTTPQEHLSSSSRPHSSTTFLSTSSLLPTRHSPRKSFIPAVSSLPSSPPQKLEDFKPSIPAIGGRQKQQIFTTPSLDELKKRIHGESFSSTGGSVIGVGLESQSHPPLPIDMPPPPPPPKNRPQQQPGRLAMTLDDRLKKLVKRTT